MLDCIPDIWQGQILKYISGQIEDIHLYIRTNTEYIRQDRILILISGRVTYIKKLDTRSIPIQTGLIETDTEFPRSSISIAISCQLDLFLVLCTYCSSGLLCILHIKARRKERKYIGCQISYMNINSCSLILIFRVGENKNIS